jgi:hypothetical protein
MRAAGLPGRLPQAPSGHRPAAPQFIARIAREGYFPQSFTHRNFELDPIYSVYPLCWTCLGNACANCLKARLPSAQLRFFKEIESLRTVLPQVAYTPVQIQYVRRSRAHRNRSQLEGRHSGPCLFSWFPKSQTELLVDYACYTNLKTLLADVLFRI